MFCQTCGTRVDPNVRFCPRCGTSTATASAATPPPPPPPPPPQPPVYAQPVQYATPPQYAQPFPQTCAPGSVPNYMMQAVITTLFCCLPFGIVAIIQASQVNTKLAAGDWQGAMNSSKNARNWCWVSFWLGLIVGGLWMVAMFLGSVA